MNNNKKYIEDDMKRARDLDKLERAWIKARDVALHISAKEVRRDKKRRKKKGKRISK